MGIRLPQKQFHNLPGLIKTTHFRDCAWIDKARAVWLNLCPLRGRLPKWPTGADCKSAGFAFDGSNPSPTTILRSPLRSELRLGKPIFSRSEDEGCRAVVRSTKADEYSPFQASPPQATAPFSVADLRFGDRWPLASMKSNAKDEVKMKEAGHYSGLSMRTKRLNHLFVVARPRTFCWLRRRRPRLTSHTEHCVSAYQRWD